jgi:hypothetical protein
MYVLIAVSLGLTAYLAVASVVSLLVALAWSSRGRALSPAGEGGQARARFALRLLPAGMGLAFVALFYAPAFLLFEPSRTEETVGPMLAALAAIAAALVLTGIARGLLSWLETRRLVARWQGSARRLRVPGLPLPAYRIAYPFPVVAVVGVLRPRLFVAESVLAGLTRQELKAVLAHEVGHLQARDNFKSLLLRFCPDPLAFLPAGNRLCRAWAEAAEAAADEHASRAGAERALALAGALVKVARMAPARQRLHLPACAFHDGALIARRVERILGGPTRGAGALSPARPWSSWGYAPVLAVSALSPAVLRAVHALTEAALRLLR